MIKQVLEKDVDSAYEIILDAKALLKNTSLQWQQGYPDYDCILNDIRSKNLYGEYVEGRLVSIACLIKGIDPNYLVIDGKWLSDDDYMSVHRIAVRDGYHKMGFASNLIQYAKEYALKNKIKSIRIDTHRANIPMLKVIEKAGFVYCGKIWVTSDKLDNERLAFEYLLK